MRVDAARGPALTPIVVSAVASLLLLAMGAGLLAFALGVVRISPESDAGEGSVKPGRMNERG